MLHKFYIQKYLDFVETILYSVNYVKILNIL